MLDPIAANVSRLSKNLSVCIVTVVLALTGSLSAAEPAPVDLRPNAVTFRHMHYGLFITQTYGVTAWPAHHTGTSTFNDFANAFDVNTFADQMAGIGVEYVYFTAWHKSIYCLGPNKALEKWLPGHTAKRDVIGEIADALAKKNIKLVIYAHPNDGHDLTPAEQARVGYGDNTGNFKVYNDFVNEVNEEVCERYGKKPNVIGFWWDSWWYTGRLDMPRLRANTLAKFPGAIILSNKYDPKFIDFLSGEGGRMGSLNGRAASKDNQTWYLGGDWWNNNPNTTISITPDGLYRFLLLTVGTGAPGGMSWALSPLADGKTWGANNQPIKVLQEFNKLISPVRPTICGVLPSRNWLLPSGTDWSKAPAFVAARSPDNKKEYVHVLKAPEGRSLDLPKPAESFSAARLYLNKHPVSILKQDDGLRLTLPAGDKWDALDTVIELTIEPSSALK